MNTIKNLMPLLAFLMCTCSALAQDISALYKKVNPSVVTIATQQKSIGSNYKNSYSNSIGSGVLISEEGDILTASHVVNNAEQIRVKFLNGEEIPAKVIRVAPVADLAMIRLAWMPKNASIAQLGNSDQVAVGDQIAVIGAPFGLDHSLSVGYISGKKEQKAHTSGFIINEFFQTDASINQGNSGGPMFNLNGEVIGISSYIISKSGGFQGLGFVATSNLAKKLVLEGDSSWTGIKGYFLNKALAWILHVPIEGGILVESVVNLSPADFAGLKGGFEKVKIHGKEIILGGDIILYVDDLAMDREGFEKLNQASGDDETFQKKTFQLKVLRGGKIVDVTFKFK